MKIINEQIIINNELKFHKVQMFMKKNIYKDHVYQVENHK